jgi:hypothetical protein
MANTDKNIVITPNIGQTADPKIVYSGANASVGAQNITLNVYPDNSGTLSWEGSAGQLLSVTNTLTGTIFAVNDVSGIPSITVQDTGQVTLAPYTGNLVIGSTTDANTAKVQVTGDIRSTGNLYYNGNILVARSLQVGTRTTVATIPLGAGGNVIVLTRTGNTNVIVTT